MKHWWYSWNFCIGVHKFIRQVHGVPRDYLCASAYFQGPVDHYCLKEKALKNEGKKRLVTLCFHSRTETQRNIAVFGVYVYLPT